MEGKTHALNSLSLSLCSSQQAVIFSLFLPSSTTIHRSGCDISNYNTDSLSSCSTNASYLRRCSDLCLALPCLAMPCLALPDMPHPITAAIQIKKHTDRQTYGQADCIYHVPVSLNIAALCCATSIRWLTHVAFAIS